MTAIVGALATLIARLHVALLLLLALGVSAAIAQTEPPKAPAKAPKKTEQKQKQQQKQPQQPQPPQQTVQPPQPQQPPLVYSPWTKICPKPPPGMAAPAKQVCLTVKEVRLETGQFLAGVALIEQQGEEKRLLRITLPLGMQIPPGTRLTLDGEQPASAAYVTCVPNGCMADFEINSNFVDRMKKGQQLLLQGVNMPGQVSNYVLPLPDFGKAIDGPPSDPDEFEKRQKAEWETRLKQQPPPAPPK